jgi:hypothetical protein
MHGQIETNLIDLVPQVRQRADAKGFVLIVAYHGP